MELISAAIGILGVIIGWLLNELTTIWTTEAMFPNGSNPRK